MPLSEDGPARVVSFAATQASYLSGARVAPASCSESSNPYTRTDKPTAPAHCHPACLCPRV